jgi:hypothetical protein
MEPLKADVWDRAKRAGSELGAGRPAVIRIIDGFLSGLGTLAVKTSLSWPEFEFGRMRVTPWPHEGTLRLSVICAGVSYMIHRS